jgi:hypothetical protein
MTVGVKTHDDIVVDGAPIIRKFRRQPIDNLRRWMRNQGGFREEEL